MVAQYASSRRGLSKLPAPPQQLPIPPWAAKNLDINPTSRSESKRKNPDLTVTDVQEVGGGEICVP